MNDDLDWQAEMLVHKIKHYLITKLGRLEYEISDEEFYEALSLTLREEIMINWTALLHTHQSCNTRILYYLSMEYLPGRILSNNITNLNAHGLIQRVAKKMHRNYRAVLRQEIEPGLGNGGLGRLASCLLDSLATLYMPAFGYGLRYQYGTFEQELWNGIQIERPDGWLLRPNPWEFRRDFRAFNIKFNGSIIQKQNEAGEEISELYDYETVRAVAFDTPIVGYSKGADFPVVTLRLWSTKESPRNFQLQRFNAGQLDQAAENMTLTDVLYPNDNHDMGKRMRLKQEFLLVSASLQDILRRHLINNQSLKNLPDKVRIQINDTHPALIVAELMRTLTQDYNFKWKESLDITRHCMNYTNHTILKEALEEWNEKRLRHLLPMQYRIIERLNQAFCDAIRKKFPHDEEKLRRMSFIEGGQIKMAHLAIFGSMHVNGVAKLHSKLLKESVFKDFSEMYPEKFLNVTNGVTPRRWLMHCNPLLREFITKRIGDDWIKDLRNIRKLEDFASDEASRQEFLDIKNQNKQKLVDFINRSNLCRDHTGSLYSCHPILNTNSIFDMQIKRIHEYKRQLLNALHLIILYQELTLDPNSRSVSRTVIFGGKAAPGYETAKHIIQMIYCLARKINNDEKVNRRLNVIFIENYNVSKAEIIIPAADLSEQISTAGMEASGTGNMKLAMNGALTIGTEDGANIEMREDITDQWWPFRFGCTADDIHAMKMDNSYCPNDIYINDEKIRKALNALNDGTFATNDLEHHVLTQCASKLIKSEHGHVPDRYFVLKDLNSYYETQKKVEELYQNPSKWAEYAIHNIAGSGNFSADVAIETYAKNIWDLQPLPIDKKILRQINKEYNEYDKCRIRPKIANIQSGGVEDKKDGFFKRLFKKK